MRIIDVEETALILGRVVHFHLKDEVVRDGKVDPRKLTFVGRLGDDSYCRVNDLFDRKRE
jgi:flavin reductase (DIM6/NTAB) family NADH-FMN oxidoreductase RutF